MLKGLYGTEGTATAAQEAGQVLGQIVRDEYPSWSAQDVADFKDATGLDNVDAIAPLAAQCFATLACCDFDKCRTEPGKQEACVKCASFLKALDAFVDFFPLDVLVTSADRSGCPPVIIPVLGPGPTSLPPTPAAPLPCKVLLGPFDAGPYYINGECVRIQGQL